MVLNMGVTVAWEATDTAILSLLNSASTKPTSNPVTTTAAPASLNPASTAGSKATSSNPAGASNGKDTTQDSSTGISTGAKAGIGVGIAVAVLLIASGIILYIRRLKKALKAAKGGPASTNETGIGKAELSADERARVPQEPPAEMAGEELR